MPSTAGAASSWAAVWASLRTSCHSAADWAVGHVKAAAGSSSLDPALAASGDATAATTTSTYPTTSAAAPPLDASSRAAAAVAGGTAYFLSHIPLALTVLFASAPADALVLGERGAAGLAWAVVSPVGWGGVAAACAEACLPRWAADRVAGLRHGKTDAALGCRVPVGTGERPRQTRGRGRWTQTKDVEEPVGVWGWVREETHNRRRDLAFLEQQHVYSFDSFTRTLLSRTAVHRPDSPAVPQRLWIPTPSSHGVRRRQARLDWLCLALSLAKLGEAFLLTRVFAAPLLALASALPWAVLLACAAALQLAGLSREGIRADIDDESTHVTADLLVASRLPSFRQPGGERRVLLAVPQPVRTTPAWRWAWRVGGCATAVGTLLLWAVLLVVPPSRPALYAWAGCAAATWALRGLYFRASGAMLEPAREDEVIGAAGNELTPRDPETRLRLLALTAAVARAASDVHPRGAYSYKQDCFDAQAVARLWAECRPNAAPGAALFHDEKQGGAPAAAAAVAAASVAAFPALKVGDAVTVEVLGVLGDTLLSSVAWMHGLKHSAADLYDCALVALRLVPGGAPVIVPAARVLAGVPPTEELRRQRRASLGGTHFVEKGAGNDGTNISWAFWIPAGEGTWLYMAPGMQFLGRRTAEVLDDDEVTRRLQVGELFISLRSVEEVKETVRMADSMTGYVMG